jgi:hypothetical protein
MILALSIRLALFQAPRRPRTLRTRLLLAAAALPMVALPAL